MLKYPTDEPKILFLDIEASSLNAAFGFCLCIGFKWAHQKKVTVYSLKTHPGRRSTDDSKLVLAAAKVIDEADILVTYFGRRYDVPFINTRLLKAKRGRFLVLPNISHIDLWEVVKKKLKLHNNRLASVIGYLELENEKTPIKGQQWVDAAAGDQRALSYVVKHNIPDVLALEEAYYILRPLITKHPRMSVNAEYPCPVCGSSWTRSKGLSTTTASNRKQRRVCMDCSHPFFGRVEKIIA